MPLVALVLCALAWVGCTTKPVHPQSVSMGYPPAGYPKVATKDLGSLLPVSFVSLDKHVPLLVVAAPPLLVATESCLTRYPVILVDTPSLLVPAAISSYFVQTCLVENLCLNASLLLF